MGDCCLKGIQWDAQPQGHNTTLAGRDCYVTGSGEDRAIIILHDLFGWTFPNTRILADHFASEVGATVYVPDIFGGEVIPADIVLNQARWTEIDLPSFLARNEKNIRGPEIVQCAEVLRSRYKHTGVIGFCYGGWGAFRLGAKDKSLVDCVVVAHPTKLEEEEIVNIGVPVQIIAPEKDPIFTDDLKAFANRVIPSLGIAYDYQHFPGLEHGFAIRGDPNITGERQGMERAKNVAAMWFRQWLG